MLGAGSLATRPLVTAGRSPRPYKLSATSGELGFAAWSFSRQAKLNAWSWHGLGGANVLAWATLGSCTYLRRDIDSYAYVLQPDTFLVAGDANPESSSVEATTQWLDFGQPGKAKTLTGIDFDGINVTAVEVYVALDGDRTGVLADTIPIGSNAGGWTYNGEIIPLELEATEFKLRFICAANEEAQINRLTLHWEPLAV